MSRIRRLSLLLGVCLCAALLGAAPWANARGTSVTVAPSRQLTPASTCAWIAAQPGFASDLNTHVWWLSVRADPTISLTIQGGYPAARFTSFALYTNPDASIGDLIDRQFPPDPGSINPFAAGTTRGVGTYTLRVLFSAPPSQPQPGVMYANVLAGTTVTLLYRLYLPDATATITGNVPLPVVTAHNAADGSLTSCPAPVTPMTWGQLDQPTMGYFARYHLGFASNPDQAYLATMLPVTNTPYVFRFQTPTTPHTLDGSPIPITPTTQLRYWSFCLYMGNYMPYRAYELGCVADEQVPLDQNGGVTIVAGPWWTRPTNATTADGVVWMPLTYPVTATAPITSVLVLVRHLLPDPGFAQSAFAVPDGMPAVPIMGSYAPTTEECSTAQFEYNSCAATATATPTNTPDTETPTASSSPMPTATSTATPIPTSPPTSAANPPTVSSPSSPSAVPATSSQASATASIPSGTGVAGAPAPVTPASVSIAATTASLPAATSGTAHPARGSGRTHGRPALLLSISLSSQRVVSGDILTVRVRTVPHARVDGTLRVETTRVMLTGKGKHRHRVVRTVVLYQPKLQGMADGQGRLTAHLRVTYKPVRSVQALLAIAVRVAHDALTKKVPVMILPIPVMILPQRPHCQAHTGR